jgi:hypothetical protein
VLCARVRLSAQRRHMRGTTRIQLIARRKVEAGVTVGQDERGGGGKAGCACEAAGEALAGWEEADVNVRRGAEVVWSVKAGRRTDVMRRIGGR